MQPGGLKVESFLGLREFADFKTLQVSAEFGFGTLDVFGIEASSRCVQFLPQGIDLPAELILHLQDQVVEV